MLTQTSETALKSLIFLALHGTDEPTSPREIAEHIGASPTYMAKITRMLVKADILRSQRGALGGVHLSREAAKITLLDVVEACQGLIVGNYCQNMKEHERPHCGFHEAMLEVHQSMVSVLSKWTVDDLARNSKTYDASNGAKPSCKMAFCPPNGCAAKG